MIFTLLLLMFVLCCRINWDTPLNDLLGDEWSGFSDPWGTNDACLRDLLAHKLGVELGESDFGWLCDGMSRSDIVK